MPTYEYFCTSCGKTIEAFQKITADPLKNCESCQKETLVRKPGGGIGLSFSRGGDGFYTNMYGQNRQSSETSSSSASEGGCCPCGKNKGACSSNANDKG